MNIIRFVALALVISAPFWCSIAMAQQSKELKDIQAQIKQKQAQIEKQLEQAKALQQQLKAAELNIASTAKALDRTQRELETNRTQQTSLVLQQTQLQVKVDQQKKALASQIRSMYMAGESDFAKMLFNLEDAAKLERTISYFQYLSAARKQQIDDFTLLVADLSAVQKSLQIKQQELVVLETEQSQQQQQLVQQQQMREMTLNKIETQIDSEAAKIEQLQINEQALLKAIEEAQRESLKGPVTLDGLATLKGKLNSPTQGRMRNMFGRIRQGQIKWKGILFNGNTGAPVRAVHDGKVLYADWLRGFGLVTVLDHGDGYMSLYGYNQALLKQVGDNVQSGETIALVGQSGGQSAPNLYFEIRHKGTPVNPSQWLKR